MATGGDVPERDPADAATTLWIVWGALLVSLVVYAGVVPQLEPTRSPNSETISLLLKVLPIVAAFEVGVIFVLRKMLYFDRVEDGGYENPESAAGGYFVACVISWALCESIAIYGFVIAVMSGRLLHYTGFAVPGAVLMIILYPRVGAHVEAYFDDETNR